MVRVERHVDRIPRRRAVDVFGNRDGAERHVLHAAPDANAPPPVETWMIPSLLLSASPFNTAFAVVSDVTLMAG